MAELLGVLAPIAFLDAGSIIPVAIVPMAIFLATARPYATSTGYVAGIFLPYVGFGVVIAFGLGWIIEGLNTWFQRFYAEPNAVELVIQVILGLAAVWFGTRMLSQPAEQTTDQPGREATPADAFALGAGTILVGLPGALPYFAAIDQVLRSDLNPGSNVMALIYYNVIIVTPLVGMMVLHALMGEASRPLFARIAAFSSRWGGRAFALLLLIFGALLVIDGMSFLVFDYPILPTG